MARDLVSDAFHNGFSDYMHGGCADYDRYPPMSDRERTQDERDGFLRGYRAAWDTDVIGNALMGARKRFPGGPGFPPVGHPPIVAVEQIADLVSAWKADRARP